MRMRNTSGWGTGFFSFNTCNGRESMEEGDEASEARRRAGEIGTNV
jgi:hypothetical protein